MTATAASLISDQNHFSYFWSTSHPDASNEFQVNWPFSSGEEAKHRFSRWPLWRPSWISNQNDFSSTRFLPSFKTICLLVQKKKQQIDFQDIYHPMFPTNFRVNWPWGVGGVGFESKLLMPHWPITTAHLEHSMLRWAKNHLFVVCSFH